MMEPGPTEGVCTNALSTLGEREYVAPAGVPSSGGKLD